MGQKFPDPTTGQDLLEELIRLTMKMQHGRASDMVVGKSHERSLMHKVFSDRKEIGEQCP